MTKTCLRCKEDKPLERFCKNSAKTDGRHIYCRDCMKTYYGKWYRKGGKKKQNQWNKDHPELIRAYNRKAMLKYRYDVSEDEYAKMLATQGGKCAICQADQPGARRKHFAVDHNHQTGEVRGLLCFECNKALSEHLERHLTSVIRYLQDHQRPLTHHDT